MNVHANFSNFGRALLTLIRISTGEAWNDIMFDCSRGRSVNHSCDDSVSYDLLVQNDFVVTGCGSTATAVFYFLSFMIIVSFIFLNLFIAIILEGFGDSNNAENMRVSEESLEEYQECWKEFDPKALGLI